MKSVQTTGTGKRNTQGTIRCLNSGKKLAILAGLLLFVLPTASWLAPAQVQPQADNGAARQEQYRAAAKRFSTLLKEHPDSGKLWSNLGAVEAMSGNCTQALKSLSRARNLDPGLFVPWYFSGWCHLVAHKDREAYAELGHATRLNPADSNAWFLKAHAASDLNRLSISLEATIRSLTLNPQRPDAYYLAGEDALSLAAQAYRQISSSSHPGHYALMLDGERNAAQGVVELSINDYQKARRVAPDDHLLQFALATAYLQAGKYAEAEQFFRALLKGYPNARWVKARLALTLAMESKKKEAVRLLQSLPVEKLSAAVVLKDYIACADQMGLAEQARQALARGEKLFPKDMAWKEWSQRPDGPSQQGSHPGTGRDLTGIGLSVHFLLLTDSQGRNVVRDLFTSSVSFERFRVSFLRSDWTRAGRELLPVLKKRSEDPGRLFALGEVLHAMAYGFYEHLATAYPDSPATMLLAADNFSAMGDQANALDIYHSMLAQSGPSPVLLRKIAKVYWVQHDWSHASETLEKLAQLDPNDPTVFVNLGRIDFYQQNVDAAETNFRHAIQIDPKMFEAHLGLAQALQRKDSLKAAVEELQTAAKLNPSNPRVHYELAQIYRRQGSKGLAGQEMARFVQLQRMKHEPSEVNTNLVPLN